MKKKQLFGLILIAFVLLILPSNINAKEKNNIKINEYQNNVVVSNIAYEKNDNNYKIIKKFADDNLTDNTKCEGKNSLLGSYDDEDSVAWLIQKLFGYVKIIGPFIVLVMSGIDFIKVIVTGDDDGMKKAQSKLIIRLILAASLFVLPDLVLALLDLFNITSSGICGLQ